MRDLVLVLGLAAMIPLIFKRPYIAVLAWTWIAIQNPHKEAYGFAISLRLNLLIVAITLIAFLMSKEPKKWPGGAIPALFVALMLWTTLACALAYDPGYSFVFYSEFIVKMALHMVLLMVTVNSRHRLMSLIMVFALSLGYHAVKIGLVAIKSGLSIGGIDKGFGPLGSMIDDRNHFSLALLMMLPLLVFMFRHFEEKLLRWAAGFGVLMTVLAVVGSQSRGGFITMALMILLLWWRSKTKVISGAIVATLAVVGSFALPDSLKERFASSYEQFGDKQTAFEDDKELDESFCMRVGTWQLGFDMTLASPIIGNGVRAIQNQPLAAQYKSPKHICSDKSMYGKLAAHNIYVEVMTDSGFVGLGIFISIIVTTWISLGRVTRKTRGDPALLWAYDLSRLLQISVLAYAVGGGLLSLAYYDGYYIIICMAAILVRLVAEAREEAPPRRIIQTRRRGAGRAAPRPA